MVGQGVEPNPGPFGFRHAFRRVIGRAVFADKQKQLRDLALARLVEQGIEPHPGPDVGASRQDDEHLEDFSWPCEACGQVLWASDMTRLSQMRSRHISRKHPDVSKLCFRRLGRLRQADAPEPADPPGPASGQDLSRAHARPRCRHRGLSGGMSAVFLNSGGLDNCYDFLQQVVPTRPHVIGVLECRASDFHARKLRAHLASLGYRAWTLSNPPNRCNQVHNGLCFAVRDDIRAHALQTHTSSAGEFITLDLEILHISLVWQRPSEVGTGLAEALSEQAEGAFSLGRPWLGIGDFNQTPTQVCPDAGFCAVAVTDDSGAFVPSRWEGRRCIDFGVCYGGSGLPSIRYGTAKISDHKIVHLELPVALTLRQGKVIKATPRYHRPEKVESMEWAASLQRAWELAPEIPEGDTEVEWQQFCHRAEKAFAWATLHCAEGSLPSAEAVEQCMQGFHRGRRPKGSLPQLVPKQSPGVRPKSEGSFRQRKLTNWLGRARELVFQSSRGNCSAQLRANVLRTWPQEVQDLDVDTAILRIEQRIALLREARRQERISAWKQDMAAMGRKATKWLKRSVTVLPASVSRVTSEGIHEVSGNNQEALLFLKGFWKDVWERPAEPQELRRLHTGSCDRASSAVSLPPDLSLCPKELMAAARLRAGGSASLDGWDGDEVSFLPLQAWVQFSSLLARWQQRNCYPEVWTHYRSSFIPKRDPEEHVLPVDALRPLSVQSCFCRVVGGALMAKSQVKRWFEAQVSPCTHGALPGRGVHTALAALTTAFAAPGAVLVSLDLSQGFDRAIPELTVGMMARQGFPVQWAQYLMHVWGKQSRWLTWSGETLSAPEVVSTSVPQGDPCAPAAFTILVQQGADELQAALQGGSCQALFIDDRNVIVFSTQDVIRTLAHWESWATRLGLKENRVKARIVPRDPAQAQALRAAGIGPELLHSEARVLGVDFCQEGGLGSSAQKRCDQGLRILGRVACAPVSFVKKEVLASTRVTALMCWGVWFNSYPQAEGLTTKLKRAVGAHANGSRHLWQMLSGPWTDPHFYATLASFGALARGISFWRRHGALLTGGAWQVCLFDSLQDLGFVRRGADFVHAVGRFSWPPPGDAGQLKGWLKQSTHVLRETWRRRCFDRFLHNAKRHDAADLRAARARYDEKQVAATRMLWRQSGAEARGVLVGAAHSTAEYARMQGQPVPRVCCFCHSRNVPSWEHLVWRCSHFREGRPFVPRHEVLSRRLGWPVRPFLARANAALLGFLAGVRVGVRVASGFRA